MSSTRRAVMDDDTATSPPPQRPSLRRRRQARARAALQQAAVTLVEQNGYTAVSVEDICEAAEVSRSTFFRYYETKAAVFAADLLAQQFGTLVDTEKTYSLARLRTIIGAQYRTMDDAAYEQERRRVRLLQTIPELRARFAQEVLRPLEFTLDYCARMLHSDRDDPRVRLLAGAVFGALATMELPDSNGNYELPTTKEQAAAHFEAALDGLIAILKPHALKPRTEAHDAG